MNTNRQKARVLTVVVLACVIGAVAVKRMRPHIAARPAIKEEAAPQDAIYAMLDAAREGDVSKYIASYTGQMETSLRQAIAESPDFRKYLKDSNAAIKGVAIADPQQVSDREMKARVEYVFQDRNEVQFMFLEKTPRGWRIARVDSAERVKTLVPYGTPVR
jgi:hypothetical protein